MTSLMDISEGLARVACAGEINGEEVDLRTVVDTDCELNILTSDSEGGKAAFCATLLAISWLRPSKRLYPETKAGHRTFHRRRFLLRYGL